MTYRSIIFIICLSILNTLAADNVSIQGHIYDRSTEKPLSGANISIEKEQRGAGSDMDGYFVIPALPRGDYELKISYIGYESSMINIELNSDTTLTVYLEPVVLPVERITITANRAEERRTPVAFSNMSRKSIEKRYWAQDIPMLLDELPNIHSYSDAGNGIGYSTLKVRGFDQRRVGVMINGIPLNDPEDHQVYWVDMPNLAANVDDIQVQRGVSNSLYGISAFGGSVNLVTSTMANERSIAATTGTGSYNTRKFSLAIGSGVIAEEYSLYARFSRIVTDGYRDNAGVELWSYFIGAARYGANTTTRVNVYGGPEVTHAAWDGVREDVMKQNRTFNPTSADYDNTIDNFNQPHYEFIHEWRLSPVLTLNNTLFYIKGTGYYEGLKHEERLRDFGLPEITTRDSDLFGDDSLSYYKVDPEEDSRLFLNDDNKYVLQHTNLVRQKWVDKDQIGWMPRLDWQHKNGTLTIGSHIDKFNSEHWGNVLWAAAVPGSVDPNLNYYSYFGEKLTAAVYLHEQLQLSKKLNIAADLQYQYKYYKFHHEKAGNFAGEDLHRFNVDYHFLNPKIGINYNLSKRLNTFAGLSLAHREPPADLYYDTWTGPDDLGVEPLFRDKNLVYENNRVAYSEYSDPLIDPEQIIDYELGWGYITSNLNFKMNLYYMDFGNEIVPYGQVDDDGTPVRGNAEKAIHQGVELSLNARIMRGFSFSGNLAFSSNRFATFTEKGWDENWQVISIDYSGNTIPLFPNRLANARLTYSFSFADASIHLQHVGKQYLDNTENDDRTLDPYTLLNLRLDSRLTFLGFQSIGLSLQLNNILNEKYIPSGYYDAWSGYNYYFPAATRNYFVELTTKL